MVTAEPSNILGHFWFARNFLSAIFGMTRKQNGAYLKMAGRLHEMRKGVRRRHDSVQQP